MNSKERVMTALRREVPDRVPFDLSYGFVGAAYDNFVRRSGTTSHFDYFGLDVEYYEFLERRADFDYAGAYYAGRLPQNKGYEFDRYGVLHEKTEGFHFTKWVPPLKEHSIEAVRSFPFCNYRDLDLYLEAARRIADIDSRGRASALAMGGETIFEVSWPLYGLEEFLVMMLSEPEICEAAFDRWTDVRLWQLETYAKYGRYDILWLGDDIANQHGMLIPPKLWRRTLKPRMKTIIECAKHYQPEGLVFYHTDGNPTEVVEDLIGIGVDILNPVQPECVDPAEYKKFYGDRISFWGTVGIQHTLPFGTVQEVKEEVRLRIETVGRGGGLLIGPSHVIEPEVPWENVVAFVEAVREYGRY
ncbi:MAG TPA: uroporphyrinogen decarboxylase family protein [archaeon]|nr:uroporphyrinogen decarboxylase family protein [archaeon]